MKYKLIIWLFGILLLSSFASSADSQYNEYWLREYCQNHFAFNTTNHISDGCGTQDLTYSSAQFHNPLKFEQGIGHSGDYAYSYPNSGVLINNASFFSISGWYNFSTGASFSIIDASEGGAGADGFHLGLMSSGSKISIVALAQSDIFTATTTKNAPTLYVITYNGSNQTWTAYENATLKGSVKSAFRISADPIYFCGGNTYTNAYHLSCDDIVIWNKTLDYSEVLNIWTGNFTTGGTSSSLDINLLSPANNTINNTVPEFHYNVTYSGLNISNCSLWTNQTGSWEARIYNATAVPNATNMYFGISLPSDGDYLWNVQCIQTNSSEYWGANNWTFIYDTNSPVISPEPDLLNNNTIVWNGSIDFYINFSDDREIYSINITYGNNGTQIYGIQNYGYNFSKINVSLNLSGNNSQAIFTKVCDAHTDTEISEIKRIDIDDKSNGLTYVIRDRWLWFEDDYIRIYPKVALEYDKPNTIKQSDRYTFIFNKARSPSTTQTFIVESNKYIDVAKMQNYGGHLVIPDIGPNGYWVDFENDEAVKYIINKINDNKVEISIDGLKSKTIIFKSIGELNCVNATYYIGNLNAVTSFTNYVLTNENTTINLNVTQDPITMPTINATLYYNNTAYYVSNTSNFTQNVTSPTLEIGTTTSNVSLYWYVGIDGRYYNLSNNYSQQVQNFFIDNCTIANMVALNISYWDERNLSSINVTVDAGFNYTYNGVNRYYALVQPSTNFTQICVSPNSTTLNGSFTITYESVDYPQRKYIDEYAYYNNQTQQINIYGLYLDEGIYANFQTINTVGTPIADVFGTMKLGALTMETEYSDGSGSVSFWEDPDETYTFIFSKEGCTSVTENLRVTDSTTRTVTMNCGEESIYTSNQSYSAGITYSFTPTGDLLNGTNYNFGFMMNSSYWTITGCTLYLKNSSGSIVGSNGAYTGTACTGTIAYNTGNLTSLTSHVEYNLNSSNNITLSRYYTIKYSYTGDFSLKHFIDDLENFTDGGFNDFSRMLLAFIVIFIITAMVTYKLDIIDPEAVTLIVILLTWIFSYIGWLTLNFGNIDPGVIGYLFIRKYILAILVTMLGGAYILKRHTD